MYTHVGSVWKQSDGTMKYAKIICPVVKSTATASRFGFGANYTFTAQNGTSLKMSGIRKIGNIRYTSSLCHISEALEFPVIDATTVFTAKSGYSRMGFRHNNSANVLYVDGHVANLKANVFPVDYYGRFWHKDPTNN